MLISQYCINLGISGGAGRGYTVQYSRYYVFVLLYYNLQDAERKPTLKWKQNRVANTAPLLWRRFSLIYELHQSWEEKLPNLTNNPPFFLSSLFLYKQSSCIAQHQIISFFPLSERLVSFLFLFYHPFPISFLLLNFSPFF